MTVAVLQQRQPEQQPPRRSTRRLRVDVPMPNDILCRQVDADIRLNHEDSAEHLLPGSIQVRPTHNTQCCPLTSSYSFNQSLERLLLHQANLQAAVSKFGEPLTKSRARRQDQATTNFRSVRDFAHWVSSYVEFKTTTLILS